MSLTKDYPVGALSVKGTNVPGIGEVMSGAAFITGHCHAGRRRATIAEINAGVTLLPAIPGFKYRLMAMAAIAIGGAVTSATLVRINGTRAAGAVVLGSLAIARLAQSVMNVVGTPFATAGAESITTLADGASFTACDANTAITADKTGSSITVATHVDFLLTYTIEA